jgi:hypothetical protein
MDDEETYTPTEISMIMNTQRKIRKNLFVRDYATLPTATVNVASSGFISKCNGEMFSRVRVELFSLIKISS